MDGSIVTQKLKRGGVSFRLYWRTKNHDGSWQKQTKTMPHGTTRKEAAAELRRIAVAVNEAMATKTKLTLPEMASVHLPTYLNKQNIRQSTRDGYNAMLKHWVLPYFHEMPLDSITPLTISQFMSHLAAEKLSCKYRKNIYSLLAFLFELATTFDFIQASPIRPLLHRPSVVRTEKPTLPLDKAKAFFAAIKAEYKPVVALLILTGMRQGEMLGLRWQDIDFENKMIHKRNVVYRGKLVEGLKETSRKSGKLRRHSIGMSDLLKRILEEHRAASPFKQSNHFVFCRPEGTALDPDHIRRSVLYPALEAAEIPITKHGSGLHQLRHTCISEVSKRLGLKVASEQAGHADIAITADVYSHVDNETKLAAASVLGTSFDFVMPSS